MSATIGFASIVEKRSANGEPLDPDAFTGAFKRPAAEVGLEPTVRLHDVRHAVATQLLRDNVHPLIVSAVLGHSSASFTMGTYQHVRDDMLDPAADALEAALSS